MKPSFLLSCAMLAPTLALAEPRCGLTGPLSPTVVEAQPVQEPTAQAVPVITPQPEALLPVSPPMDGTTAGGQAASLQVTPEVLPPWLQHIAASATTITDLGDYHGLRRVVARTGDQFMLLSGTPDGQAVVAGLMSDFSAADLARIAGSNLTELGTIHGLHGMLVRSGTQFQVFYGTPDSQRVIPGVMWDARGRNLTREQIAPVAGTVPTVTIGPVATAGGQASASSNAGAPQAGSILTIVQTTAFGTIGNPAAPRLWMFIDPLCAFSVRAMQQLRPFVASGRVQLAVIPLAVIDHETNGRSTTQALAMLSKPADQMVTAWSRGNLTSAPAPEAVGRLQANMAAAQAIRLEGTPTLIWRKTDGSEGRSDGIPGDLNAVLASLGG